MRAEMHTCGIHFGVYGMTETVSTEHSSLNKGVHAHCSSLLYLVMGVSQKYHEYSEDV